MNRKAFKKGEVVKDGPPPRLTLEQVWHKVRDQPKVIENPHLSKLLGYGVSHNKKKYILGSSILER